MPLKIAERDRLYRKRVLSIIPLVLMIILFFFLGSDYVPYAEIEKQLGWKGELRVLPEITILPDDDPFETFVKDRRRRPLTSLELNVLDETGPEKGGTTKKEEEERKIELPQKGLDPVFTRPLHTSIPYSEDYVILKMVHPIYPPDELMNGIEGEVTLEVLVNESGKVENAWVLSLIGPMSFEESALDAIKQFLFQPPVRNGGPVPMTIVFQISFRITGPRRSAAF
jgi:TonB family protein